MATESLNKKKTTSGYLQFKVGSDGLIQVRIPVGEAKAEEAVLLIEDLYTAALTGYYKSHRLNPRDVVECLRSVADAIERGQLKLTEDKYSGRARKPRT